MRFSNGALVCVALVLFFAWPPVNGGDESTCSPRPAVIRKDGRKSLVSTDSGWITAVDVRDGCRGKYQLQFITMEPGSLFLPVLLHADMIFYVHTGNGTITYIDEEQSEPDEIDVKRGDVYRVEEGSVFYVRSHPDNSSRSGRLRIYAVFSTADLDKNAYNLGSSTVGVYSNISDLVRGFDDRVLQMGFGVSEETIQGIKEVPAAPSIVPYPQKNETEPESNWIKKEGIFEAIVRSRNLLNDDPSNKKRKKDKKKKKKSKTSSFNFFDAKPDEENCNGWSTAVTEKDLKALKGSNMGAFMVNLTRGSMMGPHWNPRATEIAVVTHGRGIVQAVCPGDSKRRHCCRYKVEEGDLFVMPRFHPMAQISYNDDSFVFVGFSSAEGKNHPQFLAGQRSVLQVLDREILAAAFDAPSSTVGDLLGGQNESVMLACTSCAEEVDTEIDEEARSEEEEKRRREKEEEERKRREEEEEEAEERKKREEEAKKEEEERRRREKEEERKRREEEEKAEEEARRREKEEEEARKEEEERRKREEEEKAEEEERERREREEEEARKEEEERKRREKEEGEAQKEEEERSKREEEQRRREKEEEEARKEEERRRREEEEKAAEEEEERRREKEEEAARKEGEEGEGEGEGEGG